MNNMSPDSLAVIRTAGQFARTFEEDKICPELLLLAMLTHANCIGNRALSTVITNIPAFRVKIAQGLGTPPFGKIGPEHDVPFDTETYRVFDNAELEMKRLGHGGTIDTEHLLLGMVKLTGSRSQIMLTEVGMDMARAEEEVLRAIETAGLAGVL